MWPDQLSGKEDVDIRTGLRTVIVLAAIVCPAHCHVEWLIAKRSGSNSMECLSSLQGGSEKCLWHEKGSGGRHRPWLCVDASAHQLGYSFFAEQEVIFIFICRLCHVVQHGGSGEGDLMVIMLVQTCPQRNLMSGILVLRGEEKVATVGGNSPFRIWDLCHRLLTDGRHHRRHWEVVGEVHLAVLLALDMWSPAIVSTTPPNGRADVEGCLHSCLPPWPGDWAVLSGTSRQVRRGQTLSCGHYSSAVLAKCWPTARQAAAVGHWNLVRLGSGGICCPRTMSPAPESASCLLVMQGPPPTGDDRWMLAPCSRR